MPVILDKDRGNEPSIFTTNEKLLVLSDIEGEFDGFRKLMLQRGVMDSMFNWTFGKNHLVLVGDHFDRGNDVIRLPVAVATGSTGNRGCMAVMFMLF